MQVYTYVLVLINICCLQWFINGFNQVDLLNVGRIVGGKSISATKAKFVVSIRSFGLFICGGSLVGPRHVVTAAHCVADKPEFSLTITAGTTQLSEPGIKRHVRKITMPNNYDRPFFNMDVAVLELSRNITGENVTTIDLCNNKWKTRDIMTVYGWGKTRYVRCSNRLRMVNIPVFSRRECVKIYREYVRITPTMFCAGDLMGKDACHGDSGGPVVYQGQLCGVVSWGPECGGEMFPGVYTNINVLKSFVKKAISM